MFQPWVDGSTVPGVDKPTVNIPADSRIKPYIKFLKKKKKKKSSNG